jgi:hypothetical protein
MMIETIRCECTRSSERKSSERARMARSGNGKEWWGRKKEKYQAKGNVIIKKKR